jgi:hypothetical protein
MGMPGPLIRLHQAIAHRGTAVPVDTRQHTLCDTVQSARVVKAGLSDEIAERFPSAQVYEEALLCRWQERRELVEGEPRRHGDARLERVPGRYGAEEGLDQLSEPGQTGREGSRWRPSQPGEFSA